MVIDSASASDIEALADLLGALFLQEDEFLPNKELQIQSLTRIISDPRFGKVFCARKVESSENSSQLAAKFSLSQIVGMVSILFTESTALGAKVALREDMIVLPEYRSYGVGTKLLDAAIDFSRQTGCKRITLLTDSKNVNAQRFYEANNFKLSSMVAYRQLL